MRITISEGFNPTRNTHSQCITANNYNIRMRFSVRTLCVNGIMNVTVRTELPFHGAIYADGHRNECFVTGYGAKETTISIPFAAIEPCGIQYDSVSTFRLY